MIQSAEVSDLHKPEVSVLMIDDDRSEYSLVQPMLAESKIFTYKLDFVNTYREGYAELIHNRHSVCLLDYNLGMETGLDLMKNARRDGCHIPIILLTGTPDENIDYRVMREGAEDYLRKDEVTPDVLERAVRYTILRHRFKDAEMTAKDEKNRLISFITDELRGPLHTISEAAARAQRERNYGYNLEEISQMTDYLLEQIHDLLDINRLGHAMSQPFHETLLSLPHEIDKAVFFIKGYADQQRVRISAQVQDLLPDVKADRRRVRQMLIHIIYTILEYSTGVKNIVIAAYMEGVSLVVEVKEDGGGIPPSMIKHFLKISQTGKSALNDQGLGLPMARHYIEEHKGKLEFATKEGKFNRIRLIFPSERVLRVKNSIEEAARRRPRTKVPL